MEDTSLDQSLISLSEISEQAISSTGMKEDLQFEDLSQVVESSSKTSSRDDRLQSNPIIATTYLMYDQMIKNEELRAIQHTALLNNQEKALIDRAKADMAWLEVKKSQLREKGKENLIPAVKKKQRAIILKLQQDKEEIKRLRKVHKAASEERKLMLLQQQRVFKLQIGTSSFPEKSKRKKSLQMESTGSVEGNYSNTSSELRSKHRQVESSYKSSRSKSTVLSTGIQTEISSQRGTASSQKSISAEVEENSSVMSEVLTSSGNKPDSLKKNLGEQVLKYMKTLERNERFLNEQEKMLLLRRQSVEELVRRRQRLEEEEKKLTEKENQAIKQATHSPSTLAIKSLQDRGTSPVEIIEKVSSPERLDSKSKGSVVNESVVSAYDMSFQISNSSIPEDITENYNKTGDISTQVVSAMDSQIADQYTSEFLESPELHETRKPETSVPNSSSEIAEEITESKVQKVSDDEKSKSSMKIAVKPKHSAELILKAPLSPLHPGQQKRRYSSGSDESIIYSQTETPSEQSDLEGRVSALLEQLHKRKLEAEKLRREQKRAQREKLKIKEQSLVKQIQAYDVYIQRTKEELMEQDFDSSFTKPKIKQPRVAERSVSRTKEERRKRLSLPFEPFSESVHSELEVIMTDKIQKEPSETQDNSSAFVSQIQTEMDPVTSSIPTEESIKSPEDVESPTSIYDEVINEIAESSIVMDIETNKAVSITSEEQVIEEKSIEEKSFPSGSQKSVSPESSAETTIQSPVKISEFELETKDYKKSVSEIESAVSDDKDEILSVAEAIGSDASPQFEKSDSVVSDIETTISSSGIVEERDEVSSEKNSEVIKVFLSEKVVKTDSDITFLQVEEEDVSSEAPVLSEVKESSQLSEQHDEASLHEESVDEKPEEMKVELIEETEKFNEDDTKMMINNEIAKKQLLVENFTNAILKDLLQESLCLPLKTNFFLPVSDTEDIHSATKLEKLPSIDEQPELPPEELPSVVETDKQHSVSEDINNEELGEEVNALDVTFCVENKDDKEKSDVTTLLLNEHLIDATTEILQIYQKKKEAELLQLNTSSTLNSTFCVQDNNDSSIKKRVHEILAESSLSLNISRETSRPQDFMVTTYDILSPSPEGTPTPGSPIREAVDLKPADLSFTLLNSHGKQNEVELGVGLSVGGESDGADNEGFAQEWFDEDFGLSHTRREAEELRLQQLQIEHEIQQLQQAQEQIPFFYVREIPNKPPPPYTPPSQTPRTASPAPGVPRIPLSKQDLTRLASEESHVVPATRSDISALVTTATDYLYTAVMAGENLDLMEVPPEYYCDDDSEEENSEVQKNSQSIFKSFLFELSKQLVKDAFSWEAEEPCPAWEWPAYSQKRKKMPPRSREMLQEMVKRQVLVQFGFLPKAGKENLVIRWSRKRRDYVDELLMRESHEEEPGWTNYDQDEVTLKNEVTIAIWNSLLDDTVKVFMDIIDKKTQQQQNATPSIDMSSKN